VSKTTTQVTNESSDKVAPQRSPGYLMSPFGWAAKPLAAMLEADCSLYQSLFTLSRQRMHLIALALAHWPGEINASFARLVIGGAPPMVLDAVLGRRPAGLKRALSHLPVGVLPRASYKHLIELLEEPATAKLLYHLDSLQEEYLRLLHNIPGPLRRIAAGAINDLGIKPEGLVDGLRFLAARGAAPSFDALVADLAAIRQPMQFIARIGNLVQQLPLPEPIPPAMVGGARRLDNASEIRRLAKQWKNCLASFHLTAVNDGRAAVYFWPDAQAPAACVVTRHGRLGWALEDAKGPENVDLPPARLDEIHRAFDAAGIPRECAIEAVEHAARAPALRQYGLHGPRRRRRRDVDYEEMYEDTEAFEAALAG
jgi:hypothetical protein